MRVHTVITACAIALLGCATAASAQTVSLQFDNGRVSLNAQNAPLRTILAEWSRLGGTRFVNSDRIGGAPVTLELTAVTERQALEILLRSVAGYVVTQREGAGGLSRLGGVVILPTSVAARAPAPITFGATTVQQPAMNDARDDQGPENQVGPVRVVTPPTVFGTTPGTTSAPAVVRLPATPGAFGQVTETPPSGGIPGTQTPVRPPTTLQTAPGTSRPGEITPPPQQSQPQR
jgi:hypothetical protein